VSIKNFEIYGELTDYWRPVTPATTGSTCFKGVGLSTCVLSNAGEKYAPNLLKYDASLSGADMVCLQCCTNTHLNKDEWILHCPIDDRKKGILASTYEEEFRLDDDGRL